MLHGYVICPVSARPTHDNVLFRRYSQNSSIFSKRVSLSRVRSVKLITAISAFSGWRTPEELGQGRRAGCAGTQFVLRLSLIGNGTVFVDAPHVLLPVDLTGHGATSLDAFGASEASTTSDDPTLKPRGWWRTDPTRTRTDGLEESLAFLRDILRTQHFEVRIRSHRMISRCLTIFPASSRFAGRLRFQVSTTRE